MCRPFCGKYGGVRGGCVRIRMHKTAILLMISAHYEYATV